MGTAIWGPRRDGDGWRAALWAPEARDVRLVTSEGRHPMTRDADGWWDAPVPGSCYRLDVDGQVMPDPASRLQDGGVDAPSIPACAVTPPAWSGRDWAEAVIYELNLGCFTPEGTLQAAASRLEGLAQLGFTAIQLMPIGQFPGDRGWGYDGVLPFALHPAYGGPQDLADFIARAHDAGLMVILDLVMNHFGPEGAWLHHAAPPFFDAARQTPWGAAIDFSRPEVRGFWTQCAMHWLRDAGFDGLRLDAVHQITGPGAQDFLTDLAREVAGLTPPRHLITEDDRNLPALREAGYDASWNDDFHHAVHCALTGEDDGYYASFAVDPVGDLALALERGHVEQGQPRPGLDHPRGADCSHLPPTGFVNAIQTHDQIGNRAQGDRLITLADPHGVRVAYGLLLVAPFIPMVFMGEERGETAPFQYFADYSGDLAQAIRTGRAREFAGIAASDGPGPDPMDPATFAASRLGWADDADARSWMNLTRRALAFRSALVVPLLRSGRPETRVSRDGPGLIRAEWRFPAGGLAISLAFGQPDPAPLPRPDLRVGQAGSDYLLTVKARP
ncbi:malto-oligosyltrehalose trehalohydrolase [Paracoccus aestuarii]|uniref:Malto-oligosyltrehalose trehalohydrolase n=1 Tax=Paracoccus aestuarii TaxID=453842 RepID=A0A418ZWG8_9RHOB|nr:malto-oligosyltrehalose trehalohydrolase [Paracoccus aestuarii]RJL04839.1 malto-oligosyltrehalose trehalohydrolase [Paracoccus aestuarii]WCR01151.1 malto-oligosyltrehalose trehalohydrolase [Paracoccus aestuarii]